MSDFRKTTPKIPISLVREMDLVEFSRHFHPAIVERNYPCVANIHSLVRAVPPLIECDASNPREILDGLRDRLEACLEWRSEEWGERPSFLANMQYYASGKLRTLGLECWGVRAVIFPSRQDPALPDLVLLKDNHK